MYADVCLAGAARAVFVAVPAHMHSSFHPESTFLADGIWFRSTSSVSHARAVSSHQRPDFLRAAVLWAMSTSHTTRPVRIGLGQSELPLEDKGYAGRRLQHGVPSIKRCCDIKGKFLRRVQRCSAITPTTRRYRTPCSSYLCVLRVKMTHTTISGPVRIAPDFFASVYHLAVQSRGGGGEGRGSRHNGRSNGGTHVHDSDMAKQQAIK